MTATLKMLKRSSQLLFDLMAYQELKLIDLAPYASALRLVHRVDSNKQVTIDGEVLQVPAAGAGTSIVVVWQAGRLQAFSSNMKAKLLSFSVPAPN